MEIAFEHEDANPDNSIAAKNTTDIAIEVVADEAKMEFFRDLERQLVERNKRRRLDTTINAYFSRLPRELVNPRRFSAITDQ
uniref:Uncharacterized protein n=1 Tax=Trichogramma kaykai TaxID=54128 RepID=A0ABD2X7I7_9HYME